MTAPNHRPAVVVAAVTVVGVVVAAVAVVVVVLVGRDRLDAGAIAARAEGAVVPIRSEIDGRLLGTGTGWVLDADAGLIVTNHHVVGAGTTFAVGDDRRPATLVGTAPCDDLAVLRVDRTDDLVELPIGRQSELDDGEEVVALGYPGARSDTAAPAATSGSVSAPRASFEPDAVDLPRYPNVVVARIPIGPGGSGGPLLDREGEVVGMTSAGSLVTRGRTYAIGADRLLEILPDLSAGESAGWQGFAFAFPGSPDEVTALGSDPVLFGRAVFALGAVAGSPAADAAFADRFDGPIPIVEVDGTPMDGTLQTLCGAIGERRRGDTVAVVATDGSEALTDTLGFA